MDVIILFFLVFDPQIPFAPNGIGFSFVFSFILFFGYLVRNKFIINYSNQLRGASCFFYLHFILIVFSLARLILLGDNFEYLLGPLKAFFVFFAILSYILYYKVDFDEVFLSKLLFVYCLNAFINFSAGTFPEYFNWADVFRGRLITDSLGINPYRNNFISGSGYFSIGTAYGLFCFFYMFYSSDKKIGVLKNIGLLLASVSGFFGARTAIFAVASGFFYLMARFNLKRIIFMVFFGLIFSYFVLDDDSFLGPYKMWLFSFFQGKDDASAENLLNDMFFWPGEYIFFLGAGIVNDGSFNYTDSGFMQDILFGGIFFMLLKFAFPIYFSFKFFKYSPLFVLLFLLISFAFQIKGAFFVSNAQGMAIFYIIYFYFCNKFGHRKNN